MNKLVSVLNFIDRLSFWSGKGLSYLLFPLIGIMFCGVIARYVFHSPLMWGHETSLFIFGGLGMLVGAYCFYVGAHVKMDVFYNRFSPRGKAVIDTITALLFFYFIGVLLWQGVMFAEHAIEARARWNSPWSPIIYPFKTVVPVAAFMILLQGTAKFIRDLFFAIRGRPLT